MNLKKYIELQEKKWEDSSYIVKGNGIWNVPSMLTESEKKLLAFLTEKVYTGKGKILDLGCFLGGSTAFLAQGLSKNKNATGQIDSFDLFKLSNYELNYYFPRNNLKPPADLDTENMFLDYIAPFKSLVNMHKGNILDFKYDKTKIEILFVDIMKSSEIYDKIIKEFLTHLIPFQSIVILQDYYFGKSGVWHYVLTSKLRNKLKKITDTKINSNVLLCVDHISKEDVENCLWKNTSFTEKVESIFFALEHCESKEQEAMLKTVLQSTALNEDEKKGLDYNMLNRNN